jgi:hypothetical protein
MNSSTIHLNQGPQVHAYRHTGCWRADVGGTHFVSETWAGLVDALGHLNSLTVHTPVPPPPIETEGMRVSRILRDRTSSIGEKQAAYRDAKRLVQEGDRDVRHIADQIKNTIPESFNARNFARKLDKSFDDVTYEEIVQYENNLVRRNGLIRELAMRFQCK